MPDGESITIDNDNSSFTDVKRIILTFESTTNDNRVFISMLEVILCSYTGIKHIIMRVILRFLLNFPDQLATIL